MSSYQLIISKFLLILKLTIFPVAFLDFTTGADEFSQAFFIASSPHAGIVGLVGVDALAISIKLIIFPHAQIIDNFSFSIDKPAKSVEFIVQIHAFPEATVYLNPSANPLFLKGCAIDHANVEI